MHEDIFLPDVEEASIVGQVFVTSTYLLDFYHGILNVELELIILLYIIF
jgi:hypothetical protein